MKKNILFLVLVIFCEVLPQESVWVKAIGECYAVNITNEEARQIALENAERDAIRKVVGIKITSEHFDRVSENREGICELYSRISRSTLSGRIVAVRILNSNWQDVGGIPKFTVGIEAEVVKEEGTPDHDFVVRIRTDKEIYYEDGSKGRDELKFKIDASKDSYIYVFNIMSNDSVQLILPNPYIRDNEYKLSREVQFFEELFERIALKVKVPENRASSIEALYVVALKNKSDILNNPEWKDKIATGNSTVGALYDIQDWLIKIPVDERTENIVSYEIRKKQK